MIEQAAFPGSSFSNTIRKFGTGDTLDLSGLAFSGDATATYNAATHKLSVTSGGVTKLLTLFNPESTTFVVGDDGHGGTQVSLAVAPAAPGVELIPLSHDTALTGAGDGIFVL